MFDNVAIEMPFLDWKPAEGQLMTPEMAFECVLVSDDPAVLCTMDPILHDFSIRTSVCPNPLGMVPRLRERSTDLIVVDLEAVSSSELMRQLQDSQEIRNPTVIAVSATDGVVPGAHVILRKPVTAESGTKSLKVAYSRMLQDFRKHTRISLMASVLATDENHRTFPLTVTNIGVGGVGLALKEDLAVGSVVSFRVRLPGLGDEIAIRARVLWTRRYGVAGCEFVHLPSFDVHLLHAWLESRYRIKKPLVPIT